MGAVQILGVIVLIIGILLIGVEFVKYRLHCSFVRFIKHTLFRRNFGHITPNNSGCFTIFNFAVDEVIDGLGCAGEDEVVVDVVKPMRDILSTGVILK